MDITHAEQTAQGNVARVTGELGPGWSFAAKLIPRADSFELAELRVFPTHGARGDRWSGNPKHVPRGGLPIRRLLNVRLRDLIEAVRGIEGAEWPTEKGASWATASPDATLARLDKLLAHIEDTDPATRLSPLAAAYAELLGQGWRNPNTLLAEHLNLTPGQITSELYRARHIYDLLTPASARGRAGGELTDKARDIIKELDENGGAA